MPSTYTNELAVEMQAAGENLNVWGDTKLNYALARLSKGVAGMRTIALTGNYSLTSSNSANPVSAPENLEAYHAWLKFTGTGTFTVTIPAKAKEFTIWNACTGAVTITTGAGSTVSVDPDAVVKIVCDAANVKELGFAALGLKAYIDSAILATTGSLPATTGNNGKALVCVAGAWTPTLLTLSYISDYSAAAASDVRTGTNATKTINPAALTGSAAFQTLTDAATIAWDMASGYNAKVTLGGNRTLGAPTNMIEGLSGVLRVIQDGTGSRTLAYNACWDFGALGSPTLSTGAGKEDLIFWVCTNASTPLFKATFFASA